LSTKPRHDPPPPPPPPRRANLTCLATRGDSDDADGANASSSSRAAFVGAFAIGVDRSVARRASASTSTSQQPVVADGLEGDNNDDDQDGSCRPWLWGSHLLWVTTAKGDGTESREAAPKAQKTRAHVAPKSPVRRPPVVGVWGGHRPLQLESSQ